MTENTPNEGPESPPPPDDDWAAQLESMRVDELRREQAVQRELERIKSAGRSGGPTQEPLVPESYQA